jgi:hypothetical protein
MLVYKLGAANPSFGQAPPDYFVLCTARELGHNLAFSSESQESVCRVHRLRSMGILHPLNRPSLEKFRLLHKKFFRPEMIREDGASPTRPLAGLPLVNFFHEVVQRHTAPGTPQAWRPNYYGVRPNCSAMYWMTFSTGPTLWQSRL